MGKSHRTNVRTRKNWGGERLIYECKKKEQYVDEKIFEEFWVRL